MTTQSVTSRRLPVLAAASAAAFIIPSLAFAAMPDPFAAQTPMASAELGEYRGGFQAGSINFDLGAQITDQVRDNISGAMAGIKTQWTYNLNGKPVGVISGPVGNTPVSYNNGGWEVGNTRFDTKVTDVGVNTSVINTADNKTLSNNTQLNITVNNWSKIVPQFSGQIRSARMGFEAAIASLGRR